ncbi:MAG: zinc ribbon domain-containing protein [Chromatiales bacterium]|jgi:hypothetical protein|nr:zinc ribbon domain-containing protein [Chromatiales bacterium]
MECASCGAYNPASNNFCGQCGSKLPAQCPGCGEVNPADNRFCGRCGKNLLEGGPAKLRGSPPVSGPTALPVAAVQPGGVDVAYSSSKGQYLLSDGKSRRMHQRAHTLARQHAQQVGSPELEARALSGLGDASHMRGLPRSTHSVRRFPGWIC